MTPGFSHPWVELTVASPVPILMGESLYPHDGFKDFIIKGVYHIGDIDIPRAGGLLESKKVADLAEQFDILACAHLAGTPVAAVASAHCAADISDLRGQEFSVGTYDTSGWANIIHSDGPIIHDSEIRILDKPGSGGN